MNKPDENQQIMEDLVKILDRHDVPLYTNPQEYEELKQDMLINIVRHGHKCWDIGYSRGFENGVATEKGEIEPEEEG